MSKYLFRQYILAIILTFLSGLNLAMAMEVSNLIGVETKPKAEWGNSQNRNTYLSRGEATNLVVKFFQLEAKNSKFLSDCEVNEGECLFAFSAMTNFHKFQLDPLFLYPDVGPSYSYYKAINVATKLDLVRGYYAEAESPFRPLKPISRIEALKLILGASGSMGWKEQFELKLMEQKPNWLTSAISENSWWYARYIDGAVEKGIIDSAENFKPEETISKNEFMELMKNSKVVMP